MSASRQDMNAAGSLYFAASQQRKPPLAHVGMRAVSGWRRVPAGHRAMLRRLPDEMGRGVEAMNVGSPA